MRPESPFWQDRYDSLLFARQWCREHDSIDSDMDGQCAVYATATRQAREYLESCRIGVKEGSLDNARPVVRTRGEEADG